MTLDRGAGREHEAFADWDAAYVLGALGSADRHAYEDHLAGCDLCRAAVAELAPVPGLLARAPRPADEDAGGPPAGLVDLVLRRDARRRVRRRLFAAGIAAVLVVGLAVAVPLVTRGPTAQAGPLQTVTLVRRADTALAATVGLTPVAWGTRLTMDCVYPAASASGPYPPPTSGDAVYTLVVTDVDGRTSQVSTWSSAPGRDVRLDAATAVPLNRIASLEVRSSGGSTLLAADLVTG